MTALAVVLAALGALGQAFGARMQHAAVRSTIGGGTLHLRHQLSLVRNRTWLSGLIALGCGTALHAVALGMAPLSVVQPVGVLALPVTVLLTMRERGYQPRDFSPNMLLAVVGATGGVGAFVFLAVGSARTTVVSAEHQATATQLVVVIAAGLLVLALLTGSKVRCVLFAAATAVSYGYVSLLMRGVAQQVTELRLLDDNLLAVLGIVVAVLVGAWLLQHAYANGPPDLVVACLTVIDPLVAVGLGIGLLGEADLVDTWTATGQVACAVIACAGVFILARYHPDSQERRDPTTVGGDPFAEPSSTDRPDGSST